jgi:hypothetical protein
VRALVLLLLIAAPAVAFAAPVPKELRKPTIVGAWAITGANVGGAEQPTYHGQRWTFGEDGSFANPAYKSGSYSVQPGGVDFLFSRGEATPWLAAAEIDGETLKIAFPKARGGRAIDFSAANNNVVYTFRRIKE